MKNFLAEFGGRIDRKGKKKFYLSMFLIICFFLFVPTSFAHAGLGQDIVDAVESGLLSLISKIIYAVAEITLYFVSMLVYLGAWMIDVMLNQALYQAILGSSTTGNSTAVEVGWNTVRDFCNMFYVFFLLLIAFSTIIRNQTYNVRNLLPKVIISLFLINFSAVITKIVIDLGQVFLFGMAAWLGTFSGSNGGGAGLTAIVEYFKFQYGGITDPTSSDVVSIIFAVIYTFMLAFLYIMLAVFLLFRLIMFALLIIISPFAFFSMVLPSMQGYTRDWQRSLFSNAISGPVFIFFIYISAVMAKTLSDNPALVSQNSIESMGDTSPISFLAPVLMVIIPHIVALGMLYAAIPMSRKAGIAGSNYVVGGKLGGLGKIMGAGYLGYKIGEKSVRKVGSAGGRVHEELKRNSDWYNTKSGEFKDKALKVPFLSGAIMVKTAAGKKEQQTEIDKYRKFFTDGGFKPEQIDDYIEKSLMGNQKARDYAKAARFEMLMEKGKLTNEELIKHNYKDASGNFDENKVREDIKNIQARGKDMSDIYKQRFDWADPADMEKEADKIYSKGEMGKVKADVMSTKAGRDAMKKVMTDDEIRKWLSSKSPAEKNSLVEQLDANVRTDWSTMSTDERKEYRLMTANLAKKDEKMKRMANITVAGGVINYQTDPVTHKYVINDSFFEEAVDKFNRDDMVKLDKSLLEDKGHLLSKSNMTQIANGGSKDQVMAIKKSLEDKAGLTPTFVPEVVQVARQGGKKGKKPIQTRYDALSDPEKVLCDKLVHAYTLS